MLAERRSHATLPVADLRVAQAFWEDRLGFRPVTTSPYAILYEAGHGSAFAVTLSAGRATGAHTQMGFTVPDVVGEVADLRARGVVFEDYDLPGFSTVEGVATTAAGRAAWFKDPDGNLIGLIELAD